MRKNAEVHGLKAAKASLHRNFYPEQRPLHSCETLGKGHKCPGFRVHMGVRMQWLMQFSSSSPQLARNSHVRRKGKKPLK